MKLKFHKSFWEADCNTTLELKNLLTRVAKEGYQGTELFLPFYNIDIETTLSAHEELGLNIITGIATSGELIQDHLKSMNDQVKKAIEFSPEIINCHTGRDIFSFEDNLKLFEHALQLEQKYGVKIVHETHRFRPTFSTFETEKIVSALPELKLNLDISHWMVVHESDLADQKDRLNQIFPSVHHIHARVGFEEGPQVPNPREARWKNHLENHTQLWQQVINLAKERDEKSFTITPEFGPFPYAHTFPPSQPTPHSTLDSAMRPQEHLENHQALTDIWSANGFMKNYLTEQLQCV